MAPEPAFWKGTMATGRTVFQISTVSASWAVWVHSCPPFAEMQYCPNEIANHANSCNTSHLRSHLLEALCSPTHRVLRKMHDFCCPAYRVLRNMRYVCCPAHRVLRNMHDFCSPAPRVLRKMHYCCSPAHRVLH